MLEFADAMTVTGLDVSDGLFARVRKLFDEEAVIEASKRATDWRNPVWRHADGSVAEW